MTETSISFCSEDDSVYIYTSSSWKAKALRNRLEDAGADWEMSEHQSGDGSWKFVVSREDCRHPKMVISP